MSRRRFGMGEQLQTKNIINNKLARVFNFCAFAFPNQLKACRDILPTNATDNVRQLKAKIGCTRVPSSAWPVFGMATW